MKKWTQYVSENNKLEKAMAVLADNGIDDYPGGDMRPVPHILFDSKKDAEKALKILKKNKISSELDDDDDYIINLT